MALPSVALPASPLTFQIVQNLSLRGDCVLTPSVLHFVKGNNQIPNDVNQEGKTSKQKFIPPVSEWERTTLTEQLPEKSECSVYLDLKKRLRIDDTECSMTSKSVTVSYTGCAHLLFSVLLAALSWSHQ